MNNIHDTLKLIEEMRPEFERTKVGTPHQLHVGLRLRDDGVLRCSCGVPISQLAVPRDEIDTTNDFMVSVQGRQIVILGNPAGQLIQPEKALRLAAWLVMVADLGDLDNFHAVFDAIKNT